MVVHEKDAFLFRQEGPSKTLASIPKRFFLATRVYGDSNGMRSYSGFPLLVQRNVMVVGGADGEVPFSSRRALIPLLQCRVNGGCCWYAQFFSDFLMFKN